MQLLADVSASCNMTAILAVLAITTWTRLGAWRHTNLCHAVAAMSLEVDDISMMQQAICYEGMGKSTVDGNHEHQECSFDLSRPRARSCASRLRVMESSKSLIDTASR